jgi:type IX secretion system PorP/SprF family membrane protein
MLHRAGKMNFGFWKPLFGLWLLLFSNFVQSQDINFTQFFTNPLILNPAQTGYFDGNYRVGFNFKGQWPFAITGSRYTFQTEAPYIDFSFGEQKIKSGWMGIGINFLNDEAGDGILTYRRLSLSYAYHQAFDREHRYTLSAGVEASYVIRSVDFSKFYFNDQWVQDQGFDLSINPNEPVLRENFGYLDLGAGLYVGAQVLNKLKLEAGFSMLHINQPNDGFYADNEHLGFRYQPTLGAHYDPNERIGVDINAYYGYEKTATEFDFGAMMSYGFSTHKNAVPDNKVYIGLYCRIQDAIAPLIGYQFKKARLLLSYDVTVSKLMPAANANGGPEISFVYVGDWNKNGNGKKLYCPKF